MFILLILSYVVTPSHSSWKKWYCYVAVAFLCGVVAVASSPVNAYEDTVSLRRLLTDLKSKDVSHILESLNSIKQNSYQGDVLPLLQDIWDKRWDRNPELPRTLLSGGIVRLEVGNVLAQAFNNGVWAREPLGLRELALDLMEGDDLQAAASAILTLPLVEGSGDANRILSVTRRRGNSLFRVSILALSQMCSPDSKKALDLMRASTKQPELKQFLDDTRVSMSKFKERSKWCERKSTVVPK